MGRFSYSREDEETATPENNDQITDSNEDKPDNVITLPTEQDLNVNAVDLAQHELQAKLDASRKSDEKLLLPEEERQVALKDAEEESENVTAAMEALVGTCNDDGAPADFAMRNAVRVLLRTTQKYNIKPKNEIKMESFKNKYTKRYDKFKPVMEGLMQVIINIWEAILKLVRRAKDWIKDFIRKIFFSTKNDIKKTEDRIDTIKKNRENKTKLDEPLNKENWIASPELHILLSIDNKIENNDTTPYMRILELSQLSARIDEAAYKELAETYEEYLKELDEEKNKGVSPTKTVYGEVEMFTIFDPVLMFDIKNPTTAQEANGQKSDAGYSWIKSDMMPGEFRLAAHVSDLILPGGPPDGLGSATMIEHFQSFKSWKMIALTGEKTATSGWFPFFTTDMLVAISEIMSKAGNHMLELEKSSKPIDKIFDAIAKISEDAIKRAKGIDITDTTNTVNQERYIYNNDIIQSLKTIVETLRSTIGFVCVYVKQTHQAWNYFLDLVVNKEK